jgi:hypothetical protein
VEVNLHRFQLLTESLPQLVWNADATGLISYVNQQWRTYTGLDATDTPARWWERLAHAEDAPEVARLWQQMAQNVSPALSTELRLRQHDGVYRWFLLSIVALRRMDGSLDQWIGALSDIHAQRMQAEELERLVSLRTTALEQTATELRRSNGELESFAYAASHDLQEPLRKIQAFGDLLNKKHRANLNEDGQQYLEKILASAKCMSTLITDLLSFSRVTSRAQPLTQVALDKVVQDVVSDLEMLIQRTQGKIEAEPLPIVWADAAQMRQVFLNLLGNALKFHRPEVPPIVRISAHYWADLPEPPGQAGWRILIADNGIGFEPQYAQQIFDLFKRLHGRSQYEGTGIGLAIVKKIVERHAGKIVACSTPNVGTTFVLDLPTGVTLEERIKR